MPTTKIEHVAYSAQRVSGRDILVKPAHRKQLFIHHIGPTHLVIPLSRLH